MGAAAYRVDAAAALRQLTPDVHRRILASLTSSSLEPNKPARTRRRTQQHLLSMDAGGSGEDCDSWLDDDEQMMAILSSSLSPPPQALPPSPSWSPTELFQRMPPSPPWSPTELFQRMPPSPPGPVGFLRLSNLDDEYMLLPLQVAPCPTQTDLAVATLVATAGIIYDSTSPREWGLPGRVFKRKVAEWTPNVQYYSNDEYPLLNHAISYNIHGTFALPVFDPLTESCIAVVELITTSKRTDYADEVNKICKALEEVDLTSTNILDSPNVQVNTREMTPKAIPLFLLLFLIRAILPFTFEGDDVYILEFFLPPRCREGADQKALLESISALMKHSGGSLKAAADGDFGSLQDSELFVIEDENLNETDAQNSGGRQCESTLLLDRRSRSPERVRGSDRNCAASMHIVQHQFSGDLTNAGKSRGKSEVWQYFMKGWRSGVLQTLQQGLRI
ncbi:hypothetical protein ACQ4PT_060541 [Festuca glaucescens]